MLEITYVDWGLDVCSVKCKRFDFLTNFSIFVEYADGSCECIDDITLFVKVEVVYEK